MIKKYLKEYNEPNFKWLKDKILRAMGERAEIEDEEIDDNIKTLYISGAQSYDNCFIALNRVFNQTIKRNFNISDWDLNEETNSSEYQYKLTIMFGAPLNEASNISNPIDNALWFIEDSLYEYNINVSEIGKKKIKEFFMRCLNGFGVFKVSAPLKDSFVITKFIEFKNLIIDKKEEDDFSNSYNIFLNLEDNDMNNINSKIGLVRFYEDNTTFKIIMFGKSQTFEINHND